MEDNTEEQAPSVEEFLPNYANIESYSQDLLRTMAGAIKASNSIPSDRKADWDYYSTFKSYRDVTKAQQERIEKQIAALLKYNGVRGRVEGCDIPRMLEILTDANDQILERVGTCLDEATGVRKAIDPLLVEVSQTASNRISGSWNKRTVDKDALTGKDDKPDQIRLLGGKNVARPQVTFKEKIDNSLNPFMPRLTEKPHALKPLSILIEYDADGSERYSHPYAFEIDNFRLSEGQLQRREVDRPPIKAQPLETSPWVMVSSVEALKTMITEISQHKQIGVDLEAHTYRSYLGLTCLIQISTESKDYLVDPFPLWNDLTALNEVFANPAILKIMHGAVGDISWLQRDFSVYVVNMFDTYIAAKLLEFPRGCLSLAFLLQHYCKVHTEKRFQLADWRIRPLIPEMINYARGDTHYLMDIFHFMKDELLDKGNDQKNLLMAAYDQSNLLCKTIFTKPRISYLPLLQKCKVAFNSRQVLAFKEVYEWRNKLARTEDESEHYVLPTHMLIKISSELPREMQGILACCNPVPPLVKQHLHAIHEIILRAREQPLTSISLESKMETNDQEINSAMVSMSKVTLEITEDPFKCPLDIGHFVEAEGGLGLPVLLADEQARPRRPSVPVKKFPIINLFNNNEAGAEISQTKLKKTFLTPFQRFQMLRPYLKALNDEKADREKSDEDRIRSIKEHFDALTSMTPADYVGTGNASAEKTTEVVEEKAEEEEETVEPISLEHYDPDPGVVCKNLRRKRKQSNLEDQEAMNSKTTGKKGKTVDADVTEAMDSTEAIDFNNVDFSQYSGGAKKGSGKEFNPWKDYNKKGKNSKQKQRYKPAIGKSVTYKKN